MFLNMKLLAQHTLNGFGGMGEGTAMQMARDGRRIVGDDVALDPAGQLAHWHPHCAPVPNDLQVAGRDQLVDRAPAQSQPVSGLRDAHEQPFSIVCHSRSSMLGCANDSVDNCWPVELESRV